MFKITAVGRLGQDMELKQSGSGKQFARGSMAVDFWDSAARERKTQWVTVVSFRESVAKSIEADRFRAGTKIVVIGDLRVGTYYSQKKDAEVVSVDVIADEIEIVEWPKGDEGNAGGGGRGGRGGGGGRGNGGGRGGRRGGNRGYGDDDAFGGEG